MNPIQNLRRLELLSFKLLLFLTWAIAVLFLTYHLNLFPDLNNQTPFFPKPGAVPTVAVAALGNISENSKLGKSSAESLAQPGPGQDLPAKETHDSGKSTRENQSSDSGEAWAVMWKVLGAIASAIVAIVSALVACFRWVLGAWPRNLVATDWLAIGIAAMPYIAGLWADYLITYVILPVKNDISVPNRYSQTKQPYVLECAENVKNSWQYESVGKDRGLTRAGNYSHIFGLIATLSLVSAALMIMREPKTHPQLGFIALALGSAVFTSFLLEMGIILVRISNNDVSARMFAGAIRTLLAVILSAMFLPAFLIAINESHVKGNLGAAVLGIAIGLMGRQALALVTSRAQALLTKNTVSPEQTNDLVKIDGIKADDIERLSEEGIDSVHALALTPLPRLFFNTTYGLQRLCDWQDQALLLLSVGPAAAEIFRVNLMIRGAISAQAFARRALKMPDEFWVGDVPPAPPNGGANGQENDAPHQGVAANAGNAGTAANAAHGAAGVGNGGGAPAGPAPAEGGNAPAEVGALHQAAANAGAGKAGDAAGMAGNAGAAAVADAVGGVGEAAADAGTNPNAQGAAVVGNGGGPAGGAGNGGPGRAASGDKQTKARDSESHLDELTKLLRFQNAAQAMQVLTYLANYRRIDELRVFFQSEVRKVISVEQADPNRGLFGGKAVSRGRQITAEIHEGDFKGEAIVKLRVTAVTSDSKQNPLAGTVEFFLHPTFAPDRYTVDVENGVANFEIRSWGVFTIGAVADKGSTRLELNLAYIAGADELFYNR